MTNEQATELLALMTDQIKAPDRLTETFDRRDAQLTEVVLNSFVRLKDKLDKKIDVLTDEVCEVKANVRDIKTEAQATSRRLPTTFKQMSRLTEGNTDKEARIVKLETDNAELYHGLAKVEEFMRRAS